jgi:PAS domain S-box-containing protein
MILNGDRFVFGPPIVHVIALKSLVLWISRATVLAIGSIRLIERRNRVLPLHPGRQIAISTLLESMPEAVFVVEVTGRVVEANQAAERLAGVSKPALLEMNQTGLGKLISEHGGPPDPSQWTVTRALRGESVQERRRLTSASSELVEALISANPIREQDGRIVGALVVVHDITELAQLQEHMADAEKHDALGRMAASLAHDFNNVLDTISKAATVLEVMPDRRPEDRAVLIRMILNAVKRGSEIVANVRQFIKGGEVPSHSVDLNVLLEESIELTRPTWEAQKNVSIVRMFQPVSRVNSNAAEMRRIFTNLILNAIDAMPNGGTLIVGCREENSQVQAFVEDSGAGISEDKQSKIFQPYYTTKNKGTGLGLSSALKIVRAQNGDIKFSSKPGVGTRFTVELPPAASETQRLA